MNFFCMKNIGKERIFLLKYQDSIFPSKIYVVAVEEPDYLIKTTLTSNLQKRG